MEQVLLNTNSKPVTFKVDDGKSFNISSQLILLPNFAGHGESHTFSGWFEDNGYTKEFAASSVEADTTLYGRWSYVLTFDFGNGTIVESTTLKYNETIIYPENLTREGCVFSGWNPKPERMPA